MAKEKTGMELKGVKAINPASGEEIPIWVADYVLANYGTGAIMAVPAHDQRDFEFAKKFGLEIKQVVAPLFIGEGKNKIREDKKNTKREVVDVIIKHWNKDEYFCLDWHKYNWKSFVIGGIEKGETVEEAAVRETTEETGYQNMKLVRKIGWEMHSKFFAAHKNENRHSRRNCFYIELIDGKYKEPDPEHIKNHKGVWVDKAEIKDFINIEEVGIYWDMFLNGEKCFAEDGILIDSGNYNGLKSQEAREKITRWLSKNNLGKKAVNYKLRDWIFSRQHYWGEPIPIIKCKNCGDIPLSEKDLPLELPDVKNYEPTDTGESPLANITKWVNVKCPVCKNDAKRETDTMPNWAGSSWYYLAYAMQKISSFQFPVSSYKQIFDYWMPVDLYNGGMEHTTLHLLYSRFWHKFLFDLGYVNTAEPYAKRRSHGMILAEDGQKMSKSRGNVVNPDDVIEKYGADTVRLYEMFMGPYGDAIPWNTTSLIGMNRFLERVWNLQTRIQTPQPPLSGGLPNYPLDKGGRGVKINKTENPAINQLLHKTIKKVAEDIENLKFNTAISALMILLNEMEKEKEIFKIQYSTFIILLSPFAPHITEEIWEALGNKESIHLQSWPEYDKELAKEKEIILVVQINGKLRDQIKVMADISETDAKKLALESEKIKKWIEGKEIRKVIFVKGRLVNIVI